MTVSKFKKSYQNIAFLILNFAFLITSGFAQETPPSPSAPREVKIPKIEETSLRNGLKVVAVERKNVPLVTLSFLLDAGANAESSKEAGLANMTASLLLKGTKTRTATQIAEEIEFLGGSITSGADWKSSVVQITVTSDKIEQAVAIMSDVVLNPTFPLKEVQLLKTQTIDQLNVALKQPGTLANFVASRYTFDQHAPSGTPETLKRLSRLNISAFYREWYEPTNGTLTFAGDISPERATTLATKYFGNRQNKPVLSVPKEVSVATIAAPISRPDKTPVFKRLLIIDLPDSGQTSVVYVKKLESDRVYFDSEKQEVFTSEEYFPLLVANTVLGGGYSARLNQEIRIKRGLSYGAGSQINWEAFNSNFLTRCQTKNVSAPEVAEITIEELRKLTSELVPENELNARKATLIGDFGRNFQTTGEMSQTVGELSLFALPASELNSFTTLVQAVSAEEVRRLAAENLKGGDIIIVGDYKIFAADLKKRFPNQKVEVIPASELDLNRDDLRKIKVKSKK